MTTANKITVLRFILVPVFLILLYCDFRYAAFAVFVIASLSDLVDGKIARKYNQVSNFGKFMDPLADKVLVFSAILYFVEMQRFPGWAATIILAREFAVSGLRMLAAEKNVVIAAAYSGKIKTAVSMVGLCAMLLFRNDILDTIVWVAMVATTVYSGIEYFIKNKGAFNS